MLFFLFFLFLFRRKILDNEEAGNVCTGEERAEIEFQTEKDGRAR